VELLRIKVDRPVPLDGISLVPLLDGQMKSRPQPIGFWQFAGNRQNLTPNSGPSAWNDNQYKLVKTKATTGSCTTSWPTGPKKPTSPPPIRKCSTA